VALARHAHQLVRQPLRGRAAHWLAETLPTARPRSTLQLRRVAVGSARCPPPDRDVPARRLPVRRLPVRRLPVRRLPVRRLPVRLPERRRLVRAPCRTLPRWRRASARRRPSCRGALRRLRRSSLPPSFRPMGQRARRGSAGERRLRSLPGPGSRLRGARPTSRDPGSLVLLAPPCCERNPNTRSGDPRTHESGVRGGDNLPPGVAGTWR
jgi:hypothetical protein